MTLLAQLQAATDAASQPAATPGVSAAKAAQLAAIRTGRYNRALTTYRQLIQGKGWMSGSRIDSLLGLAHAGSRTFLKRLVDEGLVEYETRIIDEKHVTKPTRFYRWVERKDQDWS